MGIIGWIGVLVASALSILMLVIAWVEISRTRRTARTRQWSGVVGRENHARRPRQPPPDSSGSLDRSSSAPGVEPDIVTPTLLLGLGAHNFPARDFPVSPDTHPGHDFPASPDIGHGGDYGGGSDCGGGDYGGDGGGGGDGGF